MRKYALLLIALVLACSAARAFDRININFTQPPNAPYFVGQPEFNIDAEEFNTVVLKIKSKQSGSARLFWATNFDPQMNEPKSIAFSIGRSAYPKDYVFNLRAQNQYWAGYVGQLLVYPENGANGIEITSAQAEVGNLWTGLLSAWREFMLFERPLPRTINTIFGPKINGLSVNTYIYWLIILIALAYLAYFSYTQKSVKKVINHLVPRIIFVCFLFWVLLDARILVDQFRSAALNWQIFGGKSLEEKQALSTFQTFHDFYYFLKICRAKLPDRSFYSLRVPDGYIYFAEKARYYLYPHYTIGSCPTSSPTGEPDYLIIYDPQKRLKDGHPKNYRPFASCGEAGYILQRGAL